MDIICLETEAFFALIETVVVRIESQQQIKKDKWVSGIDAMRLLGITSKTTLQKFRDHGKIRISQPSKKVILYDVDSINQFLEKNSKNQF